MGAALQCNCYLQQNKVSIRFGTNLVYKPIPPYTVGEPNVKVIRYMHVATCISMSEMQTNPYAHVRMWRA